MIITFILEIVILENELNDNAPTLGK